MLGGSLNNYSTRDGSMSAAACNTRCSRLIFIRHPQCVSVTGTQLFGDGHLPKHKHKDP